MTPSVSKDGHMYSQNIQNDLDKNQTARTLLRGSIKKLKPCCQFRSDASLNVVIVRSCG